MSVEIETSCTVTDHGGDTLHIFPFSRSDMPNLGVVAGLQVNERDEVVELTTDDICDVISFLQAHFL